MNGSMEEEERPRESTSACAKVSLLSSAITPNDSMCQGILDMILEMRGTGRLSDAVTIAGQLPTQLEANSG